MVGRVIIVPASAYFYGTSTLMMQVDEVIGRSKDAGIVWAEVRGRNVRANGDLDGRTRYATVRVNAVRYAPADVSQPVPQSP
jgi:hypothetical protein